jgi:hypothetical protein
LRRWIWAAPAICALGLTAAHAAQTLGSLYKGQTAKDAGIVLGGWGSGSAKEVSDEVLNGARSLYVTTDGYYSGGRIDFTQPVDLSRSATLGGVAIRFDIKSPSAVSSSDDGGLSPGGGFFFQAMPGMPPGMGGPPRAGAYNPVAGSTEEAGVAIPTKRLRVVVFSGATEYVAVDQTVDPQDVTNGWIHVRVPLAAFKGSGGTPANWDGFKLSRLLVMGDAVDGFYLGQIDLIQTDLSISDVSAGDDQEIYEGDTADFVGGAANAAGLKFSWDFDATDGIQEDAIGRHVTFRYRKAGNYVATLTVSDPTGVMKPVSKTTGVKVNG